MDRSSRHDDYVTFDSLLDPTSHVHVAPSPLLDRSPESRLSRVEHTIAGNPESAGFQGYEYFANNNMAVRDEFLAGNVNNPYLVYARLAAEAERQGLNFLTLAAQNALITLMGSERTDRTEALFDAMEYRQSEMFLVQMSARMNDDTLSAAERVEAAEWFKLANEALYGTPNPEVFAAIARKFITPNLQATFEDGSNEQRIQQELADLLGPIEDDGHELAKIEPDAQERFNALIHERFDEMVDHIVPRSEMVDGETVEKKYSPEEIVQAIDIALQKIGAKELGWRCELVEGKELISVSAHQKLVEVGANRMHATAGVLKGKVVHEVGVHVLRSVNAEKAGWLSATYGQQGYLDFEEAFANIAGRAYWGDKDVPGAEYRYIVASLAYGLDGKEPRDMRQCFEILWRIIALDRQNRGKKSGVETAQQTAYNQCIRIFRGTPADIPGLVYLKDLAYIHGREAVNPVINMIETQEDIDLLVAGKLDPTLPDHLPIAEDIAPNTLLARKLRSRYALAA